jgi:hypothetical protein
MVRPSLVIALGLISHAAFADDAVYGRIRDEAGPIAGLDAYTRKATADVKRCGGRAVTVTRTGKPVGPDDKAFAALLDVQPPRDLDFTDAHKKASIERFNAWIEQIKRLATDATAAYTKRLSESGPAKVAAAARIAQVMSHFASAVARMEIPHDVATGEFARDKIEAFCSQTLELATPVVDRADEAVRQCAEAAKTVPAGWWNQVCR